MKQSNQKLSEALDRMIEKTSGGEHPTDALVDVAGECGMGPGMICTLGTFYNKARGAAVLRKAASDERSRSFPLADAGEAVRVCMAGMVPGLADESECELPSRRGRKTIDKTASDTGFEEDLRDEREWARKVAKAGDKMVCDQFKRLEGVWKKASKELRDKECAARERMKGNLNDLGAMVRRMSGKNLEKSARMVVNHYRKYGQSMLTAVLADADVELSTPIEKTAAAGVLPREPFFEKMDDFFRSILDYGEASLDKKAFEDVGGGEAFVRWGKLLRGEASIEDDAPKSSFYKLAADDGVEKTAASSASLGTVNVLLNAMNAARAGAARGSSLLTNFASNRGEITKEIDDELQSIRAGGPELYKTMRQLKAKETFLTLSLYDDNLSQYPMDRLEKAFNEAMLMHPTAYRKPGMTKVLMLQHLEGGGVVDPFAYGSMVKTEKDIETAYKEEEARGAPKTIKVKGEQKRDDKSSKNMGKKSDARNKYNKKRSLDYKDSIEAIKKATAQGGGKGGPI